MDDGDDARASSADAPGTTARSDLGALCGGGGPAIVGCYHSHPNGRPTPSAADAARVAEWGWLWLIATGAGLHGFMTVPDGPIAGRFAAVDLIILPPDADE